MFRGAEVKENSVAASILFERIYNKFNKILVKYIKIAKRSIMLYRYVSYYVTILNVNGIKISLYKSILITLLYTRIQPSILAVFFYLRNYNDELNL